MLQILYINNYLILPEAKVLDLHVARGTFKPACFPEESSRPNT
jgi:hypothetical protein